MQLELHQQKADNARYGLQNDSALTKTDNHVSVLTFDLLTTPVISTGICYYKRQLWTYNLHIHCMNNDTVFMSLQVPISICEGLPQDIMSSFAYVL